MQQNVGIDTKVSTSQLFFRVFNLQKTTRPNSLEEGHTMAEENVNRHHLEDRLSQQSLQI